MNHKPFAALVALLCAYVAVASFSAPAGRELRALEARIVVLRAQVDALTRQCAAPVPPPAPGHSLAGRFTINGRATE